jgi:hypothetical protein
VRRCVSARIQYPNQNNTGRTENDENIEIIELTNSKSTVDGDYEDRDLLYLDAEGEEILNIQRNMDVNKEEQLRRLTLLPGKSFYSQRSKSISIEHVPPSQKRIETQKARLPFTLATYQSKPSQLQQSQQMRLLKNLNSVEINGSILSMNMGRSSIVFNSKPNLASQHQKEIYALINNSKSNSSKEVVTLSRLERFTDSAKLLVNANLIASTEKLAANLSTGKTGKKSSKNGGGGGGISIINSSTKTTKRPKTSKL